MGRWVGCLIVLALGACTRTLPIRVELEDARAPSPRSDGFSRNVVTLRVKALIDGRLQVLPDSGANEGDVRLDDPISPSVRRLVVEGLDEDGQVFASGQSGPLDLLRDPPDDGVIRIYFSRVGELSLTGEKGAPRSGLRAVEILEDRVLFAGGLDETGCTPSDTELYDATGARIAVGPILPDGRAGAFRLVPLPNGEVIVAGGVAGCGTATTAPMTGTFAWLRFDPLGSDTRTPPGSAIRDGAAISAVSDREVVIAGGLDAASASPQVFGFAFDEAGSLFRDIGDLNLERPRSGASAVPITERRILLVGGSSTGLDRDAMATASAFVPQSGREIIEVVPLLGPVVEPGVALTLAGSVWVAGGRGPSGAPSTTLQALVVRRESENPFGDTSAMGGPLPATMSRPTVIPAGPGGALILPDDESAPVFVDELGSTSPVTRDPQLGLIGPLVGGAIGDGTIVLRDASGLYVRFNPGSSSVLGPAGPPEGRSLGSDGGPLGVSFLRPGRWERDAVGLRNATRIAGGVGTPPQELVVLGADSFGDFELEVDYTPSPESRPALIFAFTPGQFVYFDLSNITSLLQVGPGTTPENCQINQGTPGAGDARRHTAILRRAGLRLTLEIDGVALRPCDVDAESRFAAAGPLALGVINGQVTFERVRISAD